MLFRNWAKLNAANYCGKRTRWTRRKQKWDLGSSLVFRLVAAERERERGLKWGKLHNELCPLRMFWKHGQLAAAFISSCDHACSWLGDKPSLSSQNRSLLPTKDQSHDCFLFAVSGYPFLSSFLELYILILSFKCVSCCIYPPTLADQGPWESELWGLALPGSLCFSVQKMRAR